MLLLRIFRNNCPLQQTAYASWVEKVGSPPAVLKNPGESGHFLKETTMRSTLLKSVGALAGLAILTGTVLGQHSRGGNSGNNGHGGRGGSPMPSRSSAPAHTNNSPLPNHSTAPSTMRTQVTSSAVPTTSRFVAPRTTRTTVSPSSTPTASQVVVTAGRQPALPLRGRPRKASCGQPPALR